MVSQKEIIEMLMDAHYWLEGLKYKKLANRIEAEGIAPPDGWVLAPVAWINVEKRKLEWNTDFPIRWETPTVVKLDKLPLYTSPPSVDALIAEAVAKEREACAKLCDDADKSTHPSDLAEAIRARGQK